MPAGLGGVVAIAAGDTHTVAVKDDGTVVVWGSNGSGEADVPANLAGVTAVAAGGRHSAVIVSEGSVTDAPPAISTHPANVQIMAGQDASFTVVAAGSAPLSYQWYRNLGFTENLLPGETNATLTLNDVPFAENGSTYHVTVTNAHGAANSLPATLTVTPPPLLSSVSLIPVLNGAEGTNEVRFTVSRSVTTAEAIDVTLSYGGTATAGVDYTAFPNPVHIPAGTGAVDIALPVLNDTLVEGTEAILVTVQPGEGYELGAPAEITLELLDNDVAPPRPVVKLVVVRNGAEGTNEARFTILREVNLAAAIDVALVFSGTATPGVDYNGSTSPVRIPANAAGVDIALPVVNDTLVEGTETIIVSLQPGAGHELGTPASITLDLLDNDVATFARTVRFGGGSAAPGTVVTVPVELVGDGRENAAAFSVNFAPAALRFDGAALGANAAGSQFLVVSNAAANGRVGLTIARSPGQRFAAGTNQLATLTFTLLAGAPGNSAALAFGDTPFVREITDADANLLPAAFADGAVAITRGFEGDVAPRPNGNSTGSLTLADWVQVGRFFAGLDAGLSAGEIQRADCAPRATLGDGRLTLADWVQAGRYFAKLDAPLPAAGGPSALVPAGSSAPSVARASVGEPEVIVTLRGAGFVSGETNTLRLELTSSGGVNALAGSFTVPVSLLKFVAARVSPTVEATVPGGLLLNAVDFLPGQLGFALAASPGAVLPAGTVVLAEFDFAALSLGEATLAFSDLPLDREVVDASGQTLASVFEAGEAVVSVRTRGPLTMPAVSVDGATLGFELGGEPGARFEILSSTDLKVWTLVEEVVVPASGTAGVNRPILPTDTSRYYRAVPKP